MIINVSAGHAPDGGTGSGAVGFCKESTEARKITAHTIEYLERAKHTVYDCTCTINCTQKECLQKIVKKHNDHKVDLGVSVHLNCIKQSKADGKTKGIEILVLSMAGDQEKIKIANRILNKFEDAGFTNRGIKVREDLYLLIHTNEPCILIECYFCDDEDDFLLANKIGAEMIGKMIAEGIDGSSIDKHTVIAGDKITAKKNLIIRNTYLSDYTKLGVVYKGTIMPVKKVVKNRAMIADGLWINCSDSCVSIH